MLFQQVMRLDDDQRRGCFKAHPPLNADNGIAHMNIPSDAIGLRDGLQKLDGFYRVIKFLSSTDRSSPFSNCRLIFSGRVDVTGVGHAFSGRYWLEVRVSFPPTDVPQSPLLILYCAFSKFMVTPFSFRKLISRSRLSLRSRMGVRICVLGTMLW